MSIHIRPTAALAERALLPEDPGAAMALARALLEQPLMFNHHHGLWGYTGLAGDRRPLTIQSTGIGGASAAVVLDELIALGLRRAIRVGTCGALDPALGLGDLVLATRALATAGAGRALTAGDWVEPDPGLTAALRTAAPDARHGLVASTDLAYPGPPGGGRSARFTGAPDRAAWLAAGALAVDLEGAAVFGLAARRSVAVAGLLAVSDLGSPAARIGDSELAAAHERAGRLAAQALGDR